MASIKSYSHLVYTAYSKGQEPDFSSLKRPEAQALLRHVAAIGLHRGRNDIAEKAAATGGFRLTAEEVVSAREAMDARKEARGKKQQAPAPVVTGPTLDELVEDGNLYDAERKGTLTQAQYERIGDVNLAQATRGNDIDAQLLHLGTADTAYRRARKRSGRLAVAAKYKEKGELRTAANLYSDLGAHGKVAEVGRLAFEREDLDLALMCFRRGGDYTERRRVVLAYIGRGEYAKAANAVYGHEDTLQTAEQLFEGLDNKQLVKAGTIFLAEKKAACALYCFRKTNNREGLQRVGHFCLKRGGDYTALQIFEEIGDRTGLRAVANHGEYGAKVEALKLLGDDDGLVQVAYSQTKAGQLPRAQELLTNAGKPGVATFLGQFAR